MWSCQIYSLPEISENFNLTKALHSGQPGLSYLVKVHLNALKA